MSQRSDDTAPILDSYADSSDTDLSFVVPDSYTETDVSSQRDMESSLESAYTWSQYTEDIASFTPCVTDGLHTPDDVTLQQL